MKDIITMNNMLKLALPVGLAVVAGGLNYLALKQPTHDYVSIKTAILAGERFPDVEAEFVKFTVNKEIPGAILWKDLGVLHKGIVPHSLEAGDVLLLRDIAESVQRLELGPTEVAINISLEGVRFEPRLLKVGDQVGFAVRSGSLSQGTSEKVGTSGVGVSYEVLGPFQIVSLADQVRSSSRYTEDSSSRSAPMTTISVAGSWNKDDSLLDRKSSRLIESNRTQAIGAVVLYPKP